MIDLPQDAITDPVGRHDSFLETQPWITRKFDLCCLEHSVAQLFYRIGDWKVSFYGTSHLSRSILSVFPRSRLT